MPRHVKCGRENLRKRLLMFLDFLYPSVPTNCWVLFCVFFLRKCFDYTSSLFRFKKQDFNWKMLFRNSKNIYITEPPVICQSFLSGSVVCDDRLVFNF